MSLTGHDHGHDHGHKHEEREEVEKKAIKDEGDDAEKSRFIEALIKVTRGKKEMTRLDYTFRRKIIEKLSIILLVTLMS